MEVGDLVKFRQDIDVDSDIGIVIDIDGHTVRVWWSTDDEPDWTWFVNLEVINESR